MKCKHDDIEITEYGTATTRHFRQKGAWYHDSYTGYYTGKIWVKCNDCELNKEYTKYRPKWLKKIFTEALNTAEK